MRRYSVQQSSSVDDDYTSENLQTLVASVFLQQSSSVDDDCTSENLQTIQEDDSRWCRLQILSFKPNRLVAFFTAHTLGALDCVSMEFFTVLGETGWYFFRETCDVLILDILEGISRSRSCYLRDNGRLRRYSEHLLLKTVWHCLCAMPKTRFGIWQFSSYANDQTVEGAISCNLAHPHAPIKDLPFRPPRKHLREVESTVSPVSCGSLEIFSI